METNAVNKLLKESATLERRTGYMTGPIEDLANLNLNYYIEVAEASTWPTFDGADTASRIFHASIGGITDLQRAGLLTACRDLDGRRDSHPVEPE